MKGLEVEIKAAVASRDQLLSRLQQVGTYIRSYTKEDWYYGLPGEMPRTRFRLRRLGDHWVCTWKDKTVRDSMEESTETEFSVEPGNLFHEFVRGLGFELMFKKIKIGERWEVAGTTVEMSQVNDLGTFVEVELILDAEAPVSDREAARSHVRAVLYQLGLPESAVEPRTYTQLLYENLSGITKSQSSSL